MYKYVKFRNYYNLHVNTSEFQTPNNNKSFFHLLLDLKYIYILIIQIIFMKFL